MAERKLPDTLLTRLLLEVIEVEREYSTDQRNARTNREAAVAAVVEKIAHEELDSEDH